MERSRNPYVAELGVAPPEIAGRASALAAVEAALADLGRAQTAEPLLLEGLMGAGRTVLLSAIAERSLAHKFAAGIATVRRADDLATALASAVRAAATVIAARQPGAVAVRRLNDGAETLCATVGGGGSPAGALARFLRWIGTSALDSGWGLTLLLDDLHWAPAAQLATVIEGACEAADRGWPLLLAGTGLPVLAGRLRPLLGGPGESYQIVEVGPLDRSAVVQAVGLPAAALGVQVTEAASTAIGDAAAGHAFRVQAHASAAWNLAAGGEISAEAVAAARLDAASRIGSALYAPILHGVTPAERRYLRAMAELGDDPVPLGDIARRTGDSTTFGAGQSRVGPTTERLLERGVVFSRDGDTLEFAAPGLAEHVRLLA